MPQITEGCRAVPSCFADRLVVTLFWMDLKQTCSVGMEEHCSLRSLYLYDIVFTHVTDMSTFRPLVMFLDSWCAPHA